MSALVLTKLFNRSLRSSTFPNIWKSGKVSALFISGDRSDPNNYRPITTLPTVSKILEKAVHSQVYSYLEENQISTPKQFGFRPKLSTEIALAHFTDTILGNMDKGIIIGAVFLDLSRSSIPSTTPVSLTNSSRQDSRQTLSNGFSPILQTENRSLPLRTKPLPLSQSQSESHKEVFSALSFFLFMSTIYHFMLVTVKCPSTQMIL